MPILWLLLGAALVALGSMFYAQNPQATDLHFLGYGLTGVPLWLLLVVPAAAGLLLGYLMALPPRVRAAFAARRLSNQLAERDRAAAALQDKVIQLERDLAVARIPSVVPKADLIREAKAA